MINLQEKLVCWLEENNLIAIDKDLFYTKITNYQCQVNSYSQVLIVEENSESFLAALIAVLLCHKSVFIGNPQWKSQEWQQVLNIINTDIILGKIPENLQFDKSFKALITNKINLAKINPQKTSQSYFYIPTGGSSGAIKFVTHSWSTLKASVQGMQQYFAVDQINSFCILPLYHVSGLMQFLRAFLSNGQLQIYNYSQLKKQPPDGDYSDYFISLVPTQLQFLLENFPQWLSQFKTVLLGGAPAWPHLLEQAKSQGINLAPTYGMTETASQIATLKPQDFAQNYQGVGQVLPQATITIINDQGETLDNNQIGLINIRSRSLFFGYYPELETVENFCPGDLGYFDQQNYLHIVGRQNQQIITGGEKVFPAEVEAVILASGLVKDVCILGLSDRLWGEVVVAVYVPKFSHFKLQELQTYLKQNLAAYKCPKYWQGCLNLGRSPSGKINYAQLKEQFKADSNDQ